MPDIYTVPDVSEAHGSMVISRLRPAPVVFLSLLNRDVVSRDRTCSSVVEKVRFDVRFSFFCRTGDQSNTPKCTMRLTPHYERMLAAVCVVLHSNGYTGGSDGLRSVNSSEKAVPDGHCV